MKVLHLVLCPWIYSNVSWFIVYGNMNRIYILLLCENCINLNYVKLVQNAFQVYYILLLFCISILLIFESLEHIQGHKTRCKNFMVQRYWNPTESALLSLWNPVRNQYQKIFENNPHIFKFNVTFTKRDLWLSHWKPR